MGMLFSMTKANIDGVPVVVLIKPASCLKSTERLGSTWIPSLWTAPYSALSVNFPEVLYQQELMLLLVCPLE